MRTRLRAFHAMSATATIAQAASIITKSRDSDPDSDGIAAKLGPPVPPPLSDATARRTKFEL